MDQVAVFSEDRAYRYVLKRNTGFGSETCLFLMLNPSTADEIINDATVSRCIDYSNMWGYGNLIVCNLFAYRATLPSDMKKVNDPIGPDNNHWINASALKADKIIVAWGVHGAYKNRSQYVLKEVLDLKNMPVYHLGLTKDGEPKHPLYLKKLLEPIRYRSD